jgi:hypothetical protein
MVSSVSSSPIILPNLIRFQNGAGKISYPVKPDQNIFAQFKYITTFPSEDGGDNVSVYKLQILDQLLEKLVGEPGKGSDYLRISKDFADSLISKLKGELANREYNSNKSYGNLSPEKGIILNTFA